MRLLIDEDLPRSLAPALRHACIDAEDVRDVGLRGSSDENVFAHALGHRRAIVTADMGFANILAFPLGSHCGIVVCRFPNEWSVATLVSTVVRGLQGITDEEMAGNLVILEPGRIRLRRRP